jgi:uncharacterized protein YaaN involved in tellurite resistance
MLKQSTAEIAAESERGIVDIETIKTVNSDLFSTLDDLLRIQTGRGQGKTSGLRRRIEKQVFIC